MKEERLDAAVMNSLEVKEEGKRNKTPQGRRPGQAQKVASAAPSF